MVEFKKELTEEEEVELRRLGLTELQIECISRLCKRGGSMQGLRRIVKKVEFNLLLEVANIVELYEMN